MSKRNRPVESGPLSVESLGGIDIVDVPGMAMETTAVLDPPESGPPTDAELGQSDVDNREAVAAIAAAIATPGEAIAAQVNPVAPAAPDYTTIVANLDRQTAPAWPASSPFKVDWPWAAEPDPVPGDIVGWNWPQHEIAIVTAAPAITTTWPYTLTVEIRPMPAEWQQVKIFDLSSGQRLHVEWYTRWNRAYSQFAKDANECVLADESGDKEKPEAKRTTGSGWLAVVQEGKV